MHNARWLSEICTRYLPLTDAKRKPLNIDIGGVRCIILILNHIVASILR